MLRNEGLAIASPSLRNIRLSPSQLHSQQRIPTQHDMLPQHHVCRNELNCECYNITLTLQRGVMGTARMLHALTHSSISRQVRGQM